MNLVKATEEFELNGMAYPDFPLIIDSKCELVKPVFDFLVYECIQRGRVNSKHTWWSYGQAIYDYFSFLEARDISWKDFMFDNLHSTVAAYRDWSFKVCKLESITVNQRLRVVVRFYQHAHNRSWINNLPYDIESVLISQPKGFLAHTNRSGNIKNTPDVMLKEKKKVLQVLTFSQTQQLLETATNPTLNLMIRLGLQSGLRKEEILTFPLSYVFDPSRYKTHTSMIRVKLSPSDMQVKGDHERDIDIPRSLMERLWQYVLHERHHRLQNGDGSETGTLFLTEDGKLWSVKSKAFNNLLKDLCLPFKVWPHLFRHTYATHTLYYMRKQKSTVDPLMYVRDRLGHSSINTTIKYLHYLDSLEDELMTDYQREIDNI